MSSFYAPESAMAIAAHPDDIEYSCAGTLARWAQAGTRICYVLVTSGDAGIAEPGMTRERAAKIREVETREAAAVIGASEVVFLHEPDGLVEANLGLRKKLVREIRRFKPEVVLCQDPTVVFPGENYINHPDHRAVGLAAIDAVFPASGQPNVFQDLEAEGLKPHKPRKVFVTGWLQTEFFVNIDSTIDLKIAALRKHKSQMQEDPEKYIRKRTAERAKGKEMSYAEAFRVITLVEDEVWEKNNNHASI